MYIANGIGMTAQQLPARLFHSKVENLIRGWIGKVNYPLYIMVHS